MNKFLGIIAAALACQVSWSAPVRISQMARTNDLANGDLLEISRAVGASYATRAITGSNIWRGATNITAALVNSASNSLRAQIQGGSATNAIANTNGYGYETKIYGLSAQVRDPALTVNRYFSGEAPSRLHTLKVANTNMNPGTFGYENEAHIISEVGGGGTNWNSRAYWIKRLSVPISTDASGWQNEWTFGFNGGVDRTSPGQTILYGDISNFHYMWVDPTNSPYNGNFELNALQNLAGTGGYVHINKGSGAEAKAGTNGLAVWSGGATPTQVARIGGNGVVMGSALSFLADQDTGFTNASSDVIEAVFGGTRTFSLSAANWTALNGVNLILSTGGQFRGSRGNTTTPMISFAQETDNGVFSPATNAWGVTIAGAERFRVDLNGIAVPTIRATNLVFGTNQASDVSIDLTKKRSLLATNGAVSYLSCILPAGWETNSLSTVTTLTNTSGTPFPVTFAASFQRIPGGLGNTVYCTNVLKIGVSTQVGEGTNFWAVGR